MFRRWFVIFAVFALAATAAFAQADEKKPEKKKITGSRLLALPTPLAESGYLGVELKDINAENYSSFGLDSVRGVAIGKVISGSPAEKAGLKDGDVILSYNGEEITGIRKLVRLLSETAPDHTVRLVISRDGTQQELTATVGSRPKPEFADGNFTFRFPMTGDIPKIVQEAIPRDIQPEVFGGKGSGFVISGLSSRRIGVGLIRLTKQLSEYFGVSKGVLVTNVRENSPAADAGIRAGDVIVEADGSEISTELDLQRALSAKKEGDVTLTIVRERNRQNITVTPETGNDGFERFFEFRQEGPVSPDIRRLVEPAPFVQPLFRGRVV